MIFTAFFQIDFLRNYRQSVFGGINKQSVVKHEQYEMWIATSQLLFFLQKP